MSASKVQRSWKDNDEPAPKKWFAISLLSFLLVGGLLLFGWNSYWPSRPVTFVTGLAVTEYLEAILPQPAYPDWDLAGLAKAMPERGFEAWQSPKKAEGGRVAEVIAQVSGSNEVIKWLDSLSGDLEKNSLKKSDTVMVYLRGHAIQYHGKAFLLTGEFERRYLLPKSEDTQQDLAAAVSLETIFRYLHKVQAKNVVLLADICDLPTVPALGVIANDIPNLIANELKELKAKNGKALGGETQLWVITSAAAFQDTHSSNLRKKTLLQSATEYALDTAHYENGLKSLSLADFYESILRYSHHVTEGQQTPLLLRRGNNVPLIDPSSKDWLAAATVSLASFDGSLKKDIKNLANASQSKTASKPASTIALVSLQDKSASSDANNKSESVKEKEASQLGSNQAKNTGDEEAEEVSSLAKYWKLRDKWQNRDSSVSPQGWAPVDFAAKDWLDSGLTAARLERLLAIGNRNQKADNNQESVSSLVKDLEDLERAIVSPTQVGSQYGLAKDWQNTKDKMKPDSDRRAWLFPDAMPKSQQIEWIQVRQDYRTYFDGMGQLAGWLNAVLNERGQNRSELLGLVDFLVKHLVNIQSDLPKAEEALLDKRLPSNKVTAIRATLDELKSLRTKQVNALESKLKTVKTKQISWADELTRQRLLQDTNLSFENRKRIANFKLDQEHLSEPGTAANDVDRRIPLTDLLNPSDVSPNLDHFFAWAGLYQRALNMAVPAGVKTPKSSVFELNAWGHELISKSEAASAEEDPTFAWKQACLNDLNLFKTSDSRQRADTHGGGINGQAGMLLSVSKDRTLEIEVPRKVQLASTPKPLTCSVKRRDGTLVSHCSLEWKLVEPTKFQGSRKDLLGLRMRGSEDLEPGKTYEANVGEDGKVELILTTSSNSKLFEQGVKIQLNINDAQGSTGSVSTGTGWNDVQIAFPNPDSIELYAKCLNSGIPAIIRSKLKDFGPTSSGSVLSSLRVPAVDGQAQSCYELYLVNRSDEAKTVQVKIFAVAGTNSNGNGSLPGRPTSSGKLCFKSTSPINLPKNAGELNPDGSPVGGQRVNLAAEPGDKGEVPVMQNVGEFGLVMEIDEIEVIDNQTRSLNKEKIYQWIECLPVNPFGDLVKITPNNPGEKFDLQVVVPQENWQRWKLKELKISALLTDANGGKLEGSGIDSIVLNPESAEGRLLVKPKQMPKSGKPVLHIDIGGYPRAISYDSALKGEDGETRSASQAFAWLDPKGAVLMADSANPLPLVLLGDQADDMRIIVPTREQTADLELGKEINLKQIAIPIRIDFPNAGLKSASFTLLDGNFRRDFKYDRHFVPAFAIEAGNLVFRAAVEDLVVDIPFDRANFSGHITARATITESAELKTESTCKIVFDREKPLEKEVQCSAQELYEGDSLDVSLDARDQDTEVVQVYFAIDLDGPGTGKGQFDAQDLLHLKADRFEDGWTKKLEASQLKDLRTNKTYSLVARSIDKAGNVQDLNQPCKFKWLGKREAPKPKVTPTKDKSTPKPPKSVPQTVQVRVVVAGDKTLRKIDVKGIPGESKIKNGAVTTFTNVPEGLYDVTVTCEDAVGTAFEGTGKIKVTGDSPPPPVTIEVSRVK